MKKKIALLLAGTMVLSTMPLGVFAASNNYVSNVVGIDKKTLLTTNGAFGGNPGTTPTVVAGKSETYEYVDHSPVLAIELKNALTPNNADFKLNLSNAKFVTAPTVKGFTTNVNSETSVTFVWDGTTDLTTLYTAGKVIEIELNVVTTSTKTASVGITGAAGGVTSTTENIKFADIKSSAKTKATAASVSSLDDETIKFNLKITEQQVGTIQPNEVLYVELEDSDHDWDIASADVDFSDFGAGVVTGTIVNDVFTVAVPASFKATDKLPGTVTITGLQVESDDFGDLLVNVSSKNNTVTNEEVKVGTFLEYGIKASVDKDLTVPTIKAGRKVGGTSTANSDMDTLEVTVEEVIPGTLREKDALVFTLPEDVVITGFEITTADNIEYYDNNGTKLVTGTYLEEIEKTSGAAIIANDRTVDIDDNVLTLDNGFGTGSSTAKAKLGVKFYITTEYDYSGDVNVVVSGKAVDNKDLEVGKVAEVKSLFNVETKTTNIPIGYTNLETADVVISETEAGAFQSGDTFKLSLKSDNINKGSLLFAKDPTITAAGGSLKVKDDDRTESNQSIEFTVTGKTNKSDDLGSVTVSKIQVYADRTVPNTNGDALKLELSSKTSFANSTKIDYLTTNEGNADNGIVENYTFNQNVVFNLNSKVVSVDGTEVTQDAAPYVSSNSGSTMIPVRALSEALGVAPENVLWHQPTQSVTIIVSPSRTAQFTLGSDLCYINGVAVPMVSASGKSDVVEYSNNRVFLPVRFLGEKVFQVPVVWEGTTVRFN